MNETVALRPLGGVGDAPGSTVARAVIGVVPASERGHRGRLLDALEDAYPVRFEGRGPGKLDAIDGLLAFGDEGSEQAGGAPRIHCLIYSGEEEPRGEPQTVALSHHDALDRPLRGARLTEAHAARLPALVPGSGEVVLASVAGRAAWVLQAGEETRRHRVAGAPSELEPGEALRNRLAPGRCLALLALTQFVGDLTAGRGWEPPPLRAAFVIDDPNLRKPSYGHIDYARLYRSAVDHGYHVSMAMVPLDARRTHRRAVELFRTGSANLSLCIHGNDHDGPELAQPRSIDEGLVPAAQALRRVLRFERRTGIAVDRVMVAPHERLSEGALAALLACGYEAFCGARPYPWITASPDLSWLTRPVDAGPLIGWGSAQLMPGGFPLLMRLDFGHPREELVIRAFLGQPLIMYGHHDLLEPGTETLESVAAEINRLGVTGWSSLTGIARAATEQRRSGELLELRMLGRRVRFEVPDGVREVRVDTSAVAPSERTPLLVWGAAGEGAKLVTEGNVCLSAERPGFVELQMAGAVDPESVPRPRLSARPLARRRVTEWRDRSRPVLSAGRR